MTQSEVEKIKFYDVFITLCLLGYKCTCFIRLEIHDELTTQWLNNISNKWVIRINIASVRLLFEQSHEFSDSRLYK